MSTKSLIIGIAFLLLSGIGIPLVSSTHQKSTNDQERLRKASMNYWTLVSLHSRWADRSFGKNQFQRRILYRYLVDKIGEEILTDFIFTFPSPEDVYHKQVQSILYGGNWLQVRGALDVKEIKAVYTDPNGRFRPSGWNKKLFAVYGKIKKFRLDTGGRGHELILYLDDLKLRESGPGKEKRIE